jgi:hypothetical protein
MLHAALLIATLSLSPHARADSPAQSAHGHHSHAESEVHAPDDDHVAVAQFGLRATHAWTRAGVGPEALVCVELANGADRAITLTGAESPAARAAALVGFRLVDGAPTYEPMARLPLDPGAEIALAPFGLAIRLDGLARPLARGETVAVTLLTDAGTLALSVAVEAADARQHSHAGHAHD